MFLFISQFVNTPVKMKSVSLLLLLYLTVGTSNRVYIHPFSLFGSGDISCETVQSPETGPLETVSSLPAVQESMEPDPRGAPVELRNVTQRVAVLAELQNSLGLRMYRTLSRRHDDRNVLMSPLSTFGTLVTLYLGTWDKTAVSYQQLLGLNWETERPGCVHLMDGHTVLRTLRALGSLADGPRDQLRTLVWSFVDADADLSQDFLTGMKDFSDASFVRSVNFSQTEEAQKQINTFIQRTSQSPLVHTFTDLHQSTDMLFTSSVHFKGLWDRICARFLPA